MIAVLNLWPIRRCSILVLIFKIVSSTFFSRVFSFRARATKLVLGRRRASVTNPTVANPSGQRIAEFLSELHAHARSGNLCKEGILVLFIPGLGIFKIQTETKTQTGIGL